MLPQEGNANERQNCLELLVLDCRLYFCPIQVQDFPTSSRTKRKCVLCPQYKWSHFRGSLADFYCARVFSVTFSAKLWVVPVVSTDGSWEIFIGFSLDPKNMSVTDFPISRKFIFNRMLGEWMNFEIRCLARSSSAWFIMLNVTLQRGT